MDTRSPYRPRFGFGTNGFASHRLSDAIAVIADLGYDGVALTLDHCHLDPYAADLPRQVDTLAARLDRLGLAVVIETGARYLLDARRKHFPTLVSDGAERRIDLLARAITVAADLGADAVSFWSGAWPGGTPEAVVWDRLVSAVARVAERAAEVGVTLGFEPEPGMVVDTLDRYDTLCHRLGYPEHFGLTLDIGHCKCLERATVPDCVRRGASRLVNVQIDDMRRAVHTHLEFGDGEIEFPPVFDALAECGYGGLVSVELPRHSHAAPDVARRSLDFLREAAVRTPVGVPR